MRRVCRGCVEGVCEEGVSALVRMQDILDG